MEKEKLRKADVISSIIFIAFSIFIIIQAFNMPMKASYAGVQNVWYVSPALFPLIVGFALLTLGIVLGLNGIRTIGWEETKRFIISIFQIKRGKALDEKTARILGILALLFIYVYINIPRIDFFLSTSLFLIVFISSYFYDQHSLFKKMMYFYLAGTAAFILYFIVGLHSMVTNAFKYTTDILTLIFLIAYTIYARRLAGEDKDLKRRYRISIITGFAVPILLVPIFRYFLRIPLPVEGGIISVMNLIRYSVF